jgi:glucose-6-phosphate-specific signal transduction histidine kinase
VSQRDAIGDASKISTIKGRVTGAKPGQQIVLYAHAADDFGQGIWYVQPLVREPFTEISSSGSWKNQTHPGIEYAALLVDPGFQPPWTTRTLPTAGVVTVAITRGWPPIWQNWWFPSLCVAFAMVIILALHRFWVYQMTRKLNLRFEERLAERTRVAQELHDTLLQGVLSASMQLHVALDQMPEDSPSRPALNRILQLMGQVVDEGRNTLRGLRSSMESTHDLKKAFARIPQELGQDEAVDFRVIVEGEVRPLRSVIYEDVYCIGREALVNAFRHSGAKAIDAQLEYDSRQLRILVRDDGGGIDQHVLESGRDGHWGLSGMRERADRIGAKLKVMSRTGNGTEVELRVPADIAFASHSSGARFRWFAGRHERDREGAEMRPR